MFFSILLPIIFIFFFQPMQHQSHVSINYQTVMNTILTSVPILCIDYSGKITADYSVAYVQLLVSLTITQDNTIHNVDHYFLHDVE